MGSRQRHWLLLYSMRNRAAATVIAAATMPVSSPENCSQVAARSGIQWRGAVIWPIAEKSRGFALGVIIRCRGTSRAGHGGVGLRTSIGQRFSRHETKGKLKHTTVRNRSSHNELPQQLRLGCLGSSRLRHALTSVLDCPQLHPPPTLGQATTLTSKDWNWTLPIRDCNV